MPYALRSRTNSRNRNNENTNIIARHSSRSSRSSLSSRNVDNMHSSLNVANTSDNRDQANTPSLNRLPHEIIASIITLLSSHQSTLHQCTLVSKHFHSIANPMLWRSPHRQSRFSNPERFLASIANLSPQRLSTVGHHIRHLRLYGKLWTEAKWTALLPYIPLLEHLSVDSVPTITNANFEHFLQQCQHLKRLQLRCHQFTWDAVAAIGKHCHALADFEWHLAEHQSLTWLHLLTPCPLTRLHISSYLAPISSDAMAAIQSFDALTCLKICQPSYPLDNTLLIPPPGRHTLLWPRLTRLTLSTCSDLADTSMIPFFQTHAQLQHVELLRGRHALTDASLDAMARWLPELTHVVLTDMGNITSNGIRRLVQHRPSLEEVVLLACMNVSPIHFPELDDKHFSRLFALTRSKMDKVRQATMNA